MQVCDREGTFRGLIVEYGLKEFDSGAVAVKFRAELTEVYDTATGEWIPWQEYEMEVQGDAFVVKKDGTLNETTVNALVNHAGWSGSFHSISDATWKPSPCQFVVKSEAYNGKTYYKAAFVNGFDDIPGGGALPQLEPAKAKSLDARFASQLRALVGNKMRNQPPPAANSRPAAPPKAAPAVTPTMAAAQAHAANGDIPFSWVGLLVTLAAIGGSTPWLI